MVSLLTFVFIGFISIACSTGKVKVESFPLKAQVSLVNENGQITSLGNTPLEVSSSKVYKHQEFVKVLISKNGFEAKEIYISKPLLSSTQNLSANLKPIQETKKLFQDARLEEVSLKIAEAQKLGFLKEFKKAENILLGLVDEFPELSVPNDLLANIYYLTHKKDKALYYYKRADELSPGNSQRSRIIYKLNEQR